MRWLRRREPGWMHCPCQDPLTGQITHWLVKAREHSDPRIVRYCIDVALLLVRKAHHRRILGCPHHTIGD